MAVVERYVWATLVGRIVVRLMFWRNGPLQPQSPQSLAASPRGQQRTLGSYERCTNQSEVPDRSLLTLADKKHLPRFPWTRYSSACLISVASRMA